MYTVPYVENAIHIGGNCHLNTNMLNDISDYIIDTPTTYFLGIDEDDICQIKTKSIKDSYKVYNLLSDSLKTKCIWIIHKGKVIKEEI